MLQNDAAPEKTWATRIPAQYSNYPKSPYWDVYVPFCHCVHSPVGIYTFRPLFRGSENKHSGQNCPISRQKTG